ncbi:endosialin [Elgaria multicarinata webbii]|uniref:endosialin n=1 Tax=Elgaria multicarinata webbii TaxID=159646 RepID=UPI002FCD2F9B
MARLLPLLLLLLPWPWPGASQDSPAAACDPDGCLAVFAQRRSFLDAWHSCRELGGTLAALKRPEDAARLAPLLLRGSGAVQGEPRLFWIGLHRQPRQCFPGRPLRGFAWTTGDQDTAYTNWASAADGPGSAACNAQRCVALDDREFQWVEGSCVSPLDGYVCRLAYRGMCPGLDEEGAGTAVAYTTPFGPADGSLSYVPFGTVAAVACGRAGPAVSLLCLQKEDGAVAWSKEGPLCREDVYRHSWCEGDNGGCQQLCLDEGSGYSCECHAGYFLMPDGHSCAAHDACRDRPCQFGCVPLEDEEGGEGGYQCQCPAGFEPSDDDPHHCEDVDECADEASCEHQCENTEGSFVCRCHLGFSPSLDDDPGRCVDTDECQFSGVCQQMCVNYEGGFECYCNVGYELEPDGISCSPGAQLPPLATPIFVAKPTWLVEPPVHIPATWGQDSSLWLQDSTAQTVSQASPSSLPPTDTYGDDYMAPSAEPLDLSPSRPDMTSAPLEPTSAGFGPLAATWGSLQLTTGPPQNSLSHPAGETGPGSPRIPLAPTAAPLPDSSERGQGAVVGGVRALLPTPATPSPAPGEEPGRQRRDDRWLLVALLVPLCVFAVIMLAVGIVYCTRCGAQAKARSVTQCYRWVINSAGKGAPPPTSRPCQPATCRTSV